MILALGVLISFASVLLAWAHLARVRRATSGKTAELLVALKRVPVNERAAALAVRAPEGSAERRLAALIEASEDTSDDARGAAVDELLAEIELALDATASWPGAATRIAAYGGLFLTVITVLLRPSSISFTAPALLVLGLGAAATCAALGRRARELADDQRKAVDALVDTLGLRDRLAPGAPPRAPRPGRRRGA
ncbi:hypothetical protein [Polyangium mundeleinium]|uniref:Uncharacterized protein n=1 Tax=Polyangium mundeleinium TaxID=2995306 RepID=A0ABT5ENE6_9BACT|nr:hypothetical protein [Polyangium mundeleinium]MDC0743360.1 hypothetical protein [Polyangium mundeleinium]